MKRLELIRRVRSLTRDFSNSIFREQDIIDFINEGISRFVQLVPQLKGLDPLLVQEQEPGLIPEEYQHLLSVYSASRCFLQDERYYQSTTLMNEFETKIDELKSAIENGDIEIIDPITGVGIEFDNPISYVDLEPYWNVKPRGNDDFDRLGDE